MKKASSTLSLTLLFIFSSSLYAGHVDKPPVKKQKTEKITMASFIDQTLTYLAEGHTEAFTENLLVLKKLKNKKYYKKTLKKLLKEFIWSGNEEYFIKTFSLSEVQAGIDENNEILRNSLGKFTLLDYAVLTFASNDAKKLAALVDPATPFTPQANDWCNRKLQSAPGEY